MKKIIAIPALVLGGVVALGAALVGSGAFAFDAVSEPVIWMKDIADGKKLSEISIPGSHDSGARYSIGDLAGKCNDLSIAQQLDSGTRFLDLRLQLRGKSLHVVHGFVDQKLSGREVFSSINKFLDKNPSETILLSVKEESDPKNPTTSFEEALSNEASGIFGEKWDASTTLPTTLGEARGKVILLSRYRNSTIGVPCFEGWVDNPSAAFNLPNGIHVQDCYKLSDCETKKSKVDECLAYSASNATSSVSPLVLNFFSGYLASGFPPSYSVPVAKEMNPYALTVVPEYSCAGVCIFDFVSPTLCQTVIKRNAL